MPQDLIQVSKFPQGYEPSWFARDWEFSRDVEPSVLTLRRPQTRKCWSSSQRISNIYFKRSKKKYIIKDEEFCPLHLLAVCWLLIAVVPKLFGTRDQFRGRNFSTDWMGRWFQDDSNALHLLCSLFLLLLHQLHLRSSGIRCQRLRTPGLEHAWVCNVKNYRKINLLASLYIT